MADLIRLPAPVGTWEGCCISCRKGRGLVTRAIQPPTLPPGLMLMHIARRETMLWGPRSSTRRVPHTTIEKSCTSMSMSSSTVLSGIGFAIEPMLGSAGIRHGRRALYSLCVNSQQ